MISSRSSWLRTLYDRVDSEVDCMWAAPLRAFGGTNTRYPKAVAFSMPSIPSRGYPRDGNHLSSSAKVLLLGLEDRSDTHADYFVNIAVFVEYGVFIESPDDQIRVWN
jgi:hypothetical protein